MFAFSVFWRLIMRKGGSGLRWRCPARIRANGGHGPTSVARSRRSGGTPPRTDAFAGQPNGGSLAVHFSSRTDEWPTPDWLFELLDREFQFTLDPCSSTQPAEWCLEFGASHSLSALWAMSPEAMATGPRSTSTKCLRLCTGLSREAETHHRSGPSNASGVGCFTPSNCVIPDQAIPLSRRRV